MSGPTPMVVDLGPMAPDPFMGKAVIGLRELWLAKEFCDVDLIAGGQTFHAHSAALAAASASFHNCLACLSMQLCGSSELMIEFEDIRHPEAVQAMLDCIYGSDGVGYAPSSEAANRDVLILAARFQIEPLRQRAAAWLLTGLSTTNILQRLRVCEEFKLAEVREAMFAQLIANPAALFELAQDPEMTRTPHILQDLLVRVLKLLGCDSAMAKKSDPLAIGKAVAGPSMSG
eukprot:CAMPEP_0176066116 /NCGR_PEP_ID=MMETSP0120_2-20121206/32992_1 /TAXON_ID=160619 /ORGANISM="Kryptoperidinium foliaceum, Strain CCMP 1326" /LENGTH=230 /DNA_ID=CAMNT_0017399717 /DNA_START=47 /DNA_END=735 /DNA_ORIENTATION=-